MNGQKSSKVQFKESLYPSGNVIASKGITKVEGNHVKQKADAVLSCVLAQCEHNRYSLNCFSYSNQLSIPVHTSCPNLQSD